jgi:hypothetical protein
MIKLKSLIPESFFKAFTAARVGHSSYVEIFKNPSLMELKHSRSSHRDEIGAILLDDDIYTWNRDKALHVEAMKHIAPVFRDMLPILIFLRGRSVTIYVTDAARHTKWYRQPETRKYIETHPFFSHYKIEDISYWDEDVNGKWDDSEDEGDWNKDMGLTQ